MDVLPLKYSDDGLSTSMELRCCNAVIKIS